MRANETIWTSNTGRPLPGVSGATSVNIGDVNRDGLPEIAVFEGGKHNDGTRYFAWCDAPDWTRHDFHADKPAIFIGDSEMADLNRDGWLDVVAPNSYFHGQAVWIFENLLNPK